MPAPILVAGVDGRSLVLEAPVLQREGHTVEEAASARALLSSLPQSGSQLVVLGPRLIDLALPDVVSRIRCDPASRQVSILVLLTVSDPETADAQVLAAGANAVLRRPLDTTRLEAWVSKLLAVPRRVRARVPVQGHVVGTPRASGAGHFLGLTRDLSVHGMLLASPVRLEVGPDLDLEFVLPGHAARLAALGRVVREAAGVGWPYVGYGIEFLFVPPTHAHAIAAVVSQGVHLMLPDAPHDGSGGIHSTIRREQWIYELLAPMPHGHGWQVEIHRAPRDHWRPGVAGPFYVVEGGTPEDALREARSFVQRHG
jgi:CheY-like chemotaxis protein